MSSLVIKIRFACCLGIGIGIGSISASHAQNAVSPTQRLAIMGIKPSAERLVQFAAQGDRTVVDLLLLSGLDVSIAEPTRQATALHNAAAQGHLLLVKSLIEHGANIEAVDWHGNTPLIVAAYAGQFEVVAALLDHHANIRVVTNEGVTALSAAIYSGKDALVDRLLAAGADPTAPGKGAAPADIAQRAGRSATLVSIRRKLEQQ